MELDAEKMLENAIRDAIREGIKSKMSSSYNNPFDKMINDCIASMGDKLKALVSDAIQSCVGDATFREDIKVSIRHVLAKTLVARFGGELEKQVNVLKSDPATRARITLAIEEIVRSKTS